MKRRTFAGLVAVGLVLGVAVTALTVAWAQGPGGMHGPGGHGMHGMMMKGMVTAALDGALAQANVTPDQRASIDASRDRAFATFEAQRPDHRAHRDQVLALFEGDRLDVGQLQALHDPMAQRHDAVKSAVAQAIVEIHDTLTPEQRRVVAEYVRTHGPGNRLP